MRKLKMIATSMILGTSMVLSSLTGAGAEGISSVRQGSGLPAGLTRLITENDTDISGTFTRSNHIQKTRIQVEKTSRINIRSDASTECTILVRIKYDGKEILSFTISPGSGEEIFLLAGNYDMELECYQQGMLFPEKGYSYKVNYNEWHTIDTFPETVNRTDDKMEDANKITLQSFSWGSISEIETGDLYEFHSYYDDVPMELWIYSSVKGNDAGLNWNIFTPQTLKNYQNGIYEGLAPSASGSVKLMEQQTSAINIEHVVLPKGTYYLAMHSEARGLYEFRLTQKPDDGCKTMDPVYTTVGSTAVLDPATHPVERYYLTWESLKPEVAAVNEGASSNTISAKKAGSAKLVGYGTQKLSVSRMANNSYVEAKVMVEFKDVIHGSDNGKNPYYYDAVYWAADEGITGGVQNKKTGLYENFDPTGTCSRAQMVSFLWRMVGCPEPKTITDFSDVKENDYFYKAVSWAQEKGITGGYKDGTFRPYNDCNRNQAVTFLYRLDGSPDIDLSTAQSFKDIDPKDGKYYNNAVLWAAERGITGGYKDGTFRPDNQCSRGQMVSFLYRYYSTLRF